MELLCFDFLPYSKCQDPKKLTAVNLIAYQLVCCDLGTFVILGFYYEYLQNLLFFRLQLGVTVNDLQFSVVIIKDLRMTNFVTLQICLLIDLKVSHFRISLQVFRMLALEKSLTL